jgi:hypothetical protein
LGYIAPSLWITNEYGEGLRQRVAAGRNLDRWIDFKAYQVFEEATNYTALQFFTKARNDAIRVAVAPTGEFPITLRRMRGMRSFTTGRCSESAGCFLRVRRER